MGLRRNKIIAYFAAVALFLVGIVCYAAFPEEQSEEPIRIMFKSAAGNTLFTHMTHTSEDYYGFYCIDCHHYWDEDEGVKPSSCEECHITDEEEDLPKRSDALHLQCIGCHDDNGGGPMDCSECHVM